MSGPFTTSVAASVPFDGTEKVDGTPVSPAFTSDNARDGIIEARDTASGTASRAIVICGFNGKAETGRWLEFHHSQPSKKSPLIIAEPSILKAFSVSVKKNTTVTFTIYKNNSAIDTLVITSGEKARKKNLNHSLTDLDEISIEVTSGSAKEPTFALSIQTL